MRCPPEDRAREFPHVPLFAAIANSSDEFSEDVAGYFYGPESSSSVCLEEIEDDQVKKLIWEGEASDIPLLRLSRNEIPALMKQLKSGINFDPDEDDLEPLVVYAWTTKDGSLAVLG